MDERQLQRQLLLQAVKERRGQPQKICEVAIAELIRRDMFVYEKDELVLQIRRRFSRFKTTAEVYLKLGILAGMYQNNPEEFLLEFEIQILEG